MKRILTLLIPVLVAFESLRAQTHLDSFWIPNGPVNAMAKQGNNLFLGGDFSYVGYPTGYGIPIDTGTGLPYTLNIPRVNGPIYCVCPDPWGGWFIGGDFTKVGQYNRKNIAHVTKKGAVYAAWMADADGPVYAIYCDNTTSNPRVIAGGAFSTIGGVPRNNLAALNPYYGTVNSFWNPNVNGAVRTITVVSSTVFIGGSFTSVLTLPRNKIAAVSAPLFANPCAIRPFNANASGTVHAIYYNGGYLYIGGEFLLVGGQPRQHLAAVDVGSGAVQAWAPNVNGNVYCFAKKYNKKPGGAGFGGWGRLASDIPNPGMLLFGGSFTLVNGIPRGGIAEVDISSAATGNFNPAGNGTVHYICYTPKLIYVGGKFTLIGGQTRHNAACLDSLGNALPFDPRPGGTVYGISLNDTTLYIGCDAPCMGAYPRNNLACIDLTTGEANGWNPNSSDAVNSLILSPNNTIYVGGNFLTIGGQLRNHLAETDLFAGALTSFYPNVDGSIRTMILQNSKLYFTGFFNNVGGVPRTNAAAVDVTNGSLFPWNPAPNGTVNSLSAYGSKIYAGGFFTQIGSYPLNYAAALDTLSGYALPSWDINANNGVYALLPYNGTVYTGGWFSSLNSQTRTNIGAVSAADASLSSWNPGADGFVKALYVYNGKLYAGGDFQNIGGQTHYRIAELDISSGAPSSLNFKADRNPNVIIVEGDTLFAGGNFIVADTNVHAYFAVYTLQTIIGTNEIALSSDISIFPNPNNGLFSILSDKEMRNAELKIYDITGKEIVSEQEFDLQPGEAKTINLSPFSSGIYFLKLSNAENSFSAKIIRQ